MRSPSAATMARARAMNEANLPDTCTAVTKGEGQSDGEGGFTYPEIETPFRCRFQTVATTAAESLEGEQLVQMGTTMLAYAADFELPVDATLTVTRASGEVERWDVVGLVPDPSYRVLRRALVRRARNVEEAEES